MPLLERVKFCAIYTTNLDEFYMVRVAGLRDQIDAGVENPGQDGLTPSETIALIRERVLELGRRLSDCFEGQPAPRAGRARASACVGVERARRRAARASSPSTSSSVIFPALTPLAVAPGRPFPYISNLSLSLAVLVRDPDTEQTVFARVKVPTEILPRFVDAGAGSDGTGASAVSCCVRAGGRDRPPPRRALPGHGDRRLRRVPGHPRRRPGGLRRRRRPAAGGRGRAAPPALRRDRARRGRRALLRAPARGADGAARRRARTRSTRSTGCSTWARCGRSSSCPGMPSCATSRSRPSPTRACCATRASARTCSARCAKATCSCITPTTRSRPRSSASSSRPWPTRTCSRSSRPSIARATTRRSCRR